MALEEIDSDELKRLRAELAQTKPHKVLLDKLGQNPKTRLATFKLLKELDPNMVIPELDAAAPIMDEIAAIRKEREEEKKAAKEKADEEEKKRMLADGEEKMAKGRKWLKEQGYQDEGIKKIEDLMEKRGIPDYEAAEAYFAKQNPPEESIVPSHDWNRSSGLFEPPEGNPWKEAVSFPRGVKQDRALRAAQAKEINGFFKDLGQRR